MNEVSEYERILSIKNDENIEFLNKLTLRMNEHKLISEVQLLGYRLDVLYMLYEKVLCSDSILQFVNESMESSDVGNSFEVENDGVFMEYLSRNRLEMNERIEIELEIEIGNTLELLRCSKKLLEFFAEGNRSTAEEFLQADDDSNVVHGRFKLKL
uniref:Uncharacterized protein n=1 Tax=Timspurckia oligopyrenoides TaxID=708627 RepID=A0A7S0ZIR2_9RHOD|mmetsp:Transcript_6866/g.12288  ORF Transcript_6866/g.12288 Transcript_6866/m.12288 type:complete len:156 (+) Transcript_6866:811-1278(+)